MSEGKKTPEGQIETADVAEEHQDLKSELSDQDLKAVSGGVTIIDGQEATSDDTSFHLKPLNLGEGVSAGSSKKQIP